MPRPDFFTITLLTDETTMVKQPARRVATPLVRRRPSSSSRVLQLLADHRPGKVLQKAALVTIDQAYSALLEIAPPEGGQRVVEASAPVDPADPYSPLLRIEASPTHCRICLPTSRSLGEGPGERTPPVQIKSHLNRASVSVSPGALHLALVGASGDWRVSGKYVEARPDASSEGLLRVLRTIRSRLDESISRETTLLEMVTASGFGRSPKVDGIIAARAALEEMRGVLDVDAIVHRRRCQKRRRRPREISCRPAAEMEDAEMLANRMRALHVDEVDDDEEVLAKRLRTLCV